MPTKDARIQGEWQVTRMIDKYATRWSSRDKLLLQVRRQNANWMNNQEPRWSKMTQGQKGKKQITWEATVMPSLSAVPTKCKNQDPRRLHRQWSRWAKLNHKSRSCIKNTTNEYGKYKKTNTEVPRGPQSVECIQETWCRHESPHLGKGAKVKRHTTRATCQCV